MLERFKIAKQSEISRLERLFELGNFPAPLNCFRPSFEKTLRAKGKGAIIAEYKRASPSKGDIRMDLAPEKVALTYADLGAAAISVLTEEVYFKGDFNFLFTMAGSYYYGGLSHNLPLLRKDFLFHPLQIQQSAASPVSAVLLIVRMLNPDQLNNLLALCESFGLEAVVEVFDREDLSIAQHCNAKIIQVNNRDLANMKIDLSRSKQLIEYKRSNELWISASGIKSYSELSQMVEYGFDAVLVGSYLMSAKDPGKALASLQIIN